MELLRLLTLVYAGVLVLALAVGLIAILIYLRRTARLLGEARSALESARRDTAPLEELLGPVRDVTDEASRELGAAQSALERSDRHLEALLERLGVVQLSG